MARKARSPGVGVGHGIREQKPLICQDCGETFMAARSDALRCPSCRKRSAARLAHNARKTIHPGAGTGHGPRPAYEHVCQDCGATFMATRSDALRCDSCKAVHERDTQRRSDRSTRYDTCPECGRRKYKLSTGCIHCRNKKWTAEKNPNWKGGQTMNGDYIAIRRQRGKSAYTLQHIAVWEDAHGPLPHAWNVHHLNGIKTDNRLENLLGLPNHEHHSHPHEAVKPYEARIRTLEARLQAAGLPIN